MKNLSYQITAFAGGGGDQFAWERAVTRRRLWVGLAFVATFGGLVGVLVGSL